MASTSGSVPVPPYLSVPNQAHPNEAEYDALKRTYLSLLPPPQIIDICLIFEAYAPIHVRGSVWPYDLKASIVTLLAKKSPSTPTPAGESQPDQQQQDQLTSNGSTNHEPPPIEPLTDTTSTAPGPLELPTTNNVQTSNSTSESQIPPASSEQTTTAPTTQLPPQPQHAPYYPYASHPQQPPYPHAPYYPPPSHTQAPYYNQVPSYPPYAPQNPPYNSYPYHNPQPQQPNYTPPPFTHPPPLTRPDGTPAEDLPSYEEMIVEALTECTDPEGAAPKDLFAFMAARWPLQTNFRPSASQALQKAFKRGRLEKRSNGKYKLNINWEGGTTSRRNTRRPQTQAVVRMQQTMSQPSPFTTAPLENHPHEPTPPPSGQPLPPSYSTAPYAYGYPGYPHQKSQAEHSGSVSLGPVTSEDVGEGSDAWEAAQNILKAINFGDYFQQHDPSSSSEMPQNQSTPTVSPEGQQISSIPTDPHSTVQDRNDDKEPSRVDRAGLQAELALLAAQLAELGESTGSEDLAGVSEDMPSVIESLRF